MPSLITTSTKNAAFYDGETLHNLDDTSRYLTHPRRPKVHDLYIQHRTLQLHSSRRYKRTLLYHSRHPVEFPP